MSIHSQALQLFKEGNSLVDVAITLDISKDDVIQIYSDYLVLKNMGKVAAILQEYKNELYTFSKIFYYVRKNNIKWDNVSKRLIIK